VFGPVLESSRLPLSIPWALHSSEVNGTQVNLQRGCLARSLLGNDIFPSWRGGVDRLAYPLHGPMALSRLLRTQGLQIRCRQVL
jgi:hypothetical protein